MLLPASASMLPVSLKVSAALCIWHPIEIAVGGYGASRNLNLIAAFMPDLSNNGHGLLGQSGFFDNVSFVKFRSRKGVVEIGSRWR
jgi:hypothetical protein